MRKHRSSSKKVKTCVMTTTKQGHSKVLLRTSQHKLVDNIPQSHLKNAPEPNTGEVINEERLTTERQLMINALLGFCIIVIIQLSTSPSPGNAQIIAIYCLSASIPFLAMIAVYLRWQEIHKKYDFPAPKTRLGCLFAAILALSITFSYIGLVSFFFHFGFIPGTIFTCSSIAALWTHRLWRDTLET
jgi:hypothetical protein